MNETKHSNEKGMKKNCQGSIFLTLKQLAITRFFKVTIKSS